MRHKPPIKTEPAINEELERIILRGEIAEQDSFTKKRIADYLAVQRAYQREQMDAAVAHEETMMIATIPRVNVLRHRRIDATDFPAGTPIRAAFDELSAERGTFQESEREIKLFLDSLAAAQRAVDSFDDDDHTDPLAYTTAVATVEFYRAKLRKRSAAGQTQRSRFECFEGNLRYLYAQYSSLVDKLNAIHALDAPYALFETVDERARDVGEVARLEFLLDVIMRPATGARRAAA
jgi:hypothetical protein